MIYKQNTFRSSFQFAVTSSTDVCNLKSTFCTFSKRVHPDKNGNSASTTLVQLNLFDTFQYSKQDDETVEIERQKLWEKNRVFREQREEKKKRENENREKGKMIGSRNMNYLLMTTVLSISGIRTYLAKAKKNRDE